MLHHFIKTALRNIRKKKGSALIHIVGLAVAMTVCLFLFQLIRYEKSYDGFYENADRIYRITDRSHSRAQASLAGALPEMFPEVEKAGRVMFFEGFARIRDHLIPDLRLHFADPEIWDIFSMSSLKGRGRESLSEPMSVLITQSASEKYFGETDPIGKTIRFSNRIPFQVAGIIPDIPKNTHFRYEIMASMSSLKSIIGEDFLKGWGSREFFTYLLLKKGTDSSVLSGKFDDLKEKYGLERPEYRLQPLKDIHLSGNLQGEMEVNSDRTYVTVLAAVSFFILLMACLNYINLSTARVSRRLKEIGLRKVVGSGRKDVIFQLLIESLLTASLAMAVSLSAVFLLLPSLRSYWNRPLSFNLWQDPVVAGLVLGIPLVVGFLSGVFPAVSMSSLTPLMMFRGRIDRKGRLRMRGVLIVFQYVITVFLIASFFIVRGQLRFIKTSSSAAYGEPVVMIDLAGGDLRRHHLPFRDKLLSHSGILDASASYNLPYMMTTGSWCAWPGQDEGERFIIRHSCVDRNFIDFYSISLKSGRNFLPGSTSEEKPTVLVNETAARLMGGDDVVGRTVSSGLFKDAVVIGVMTDFHFKPLHQRIEPLALTLLQSKGRYAGANHLAVKIDPRRVHDVLSFIKETWEEFAPAYPLSYDFLDDRIEALYRQEIKMGEGIGILTGIEIFLAALGLFGLMISTIERKTKDIGIRKVLGASSMRIVMVLSRSIVIWIGAAALIAVPAALFVMNRWLDNFIYHTTIGWFPFLASVLIVIGVSYLTVGYHTLRAALSNPVDSLRRE